MRWRAGVVPPAPLVATCNIPEFLNSPLGLWGTGPSRGPQGEGGTAAALRVSDLSEDPLSKREDAHAPRSSQGWHMWAVPPPLGSGAEGSIATMST